MDMLWDYLQAVFMEGLIIGAVFWSLVYVVVGSSSFVAALRSAFIAEAIGNLPYFWGITSTEPPNLLMGLVGAIIFVRLIVRVGELTMTQTIYGTTMTYFFLVALTACAA
ncbi:MAG: hypothetical protein AAF513_12345 [Pseudomonadota bacterium]